MASPAANYDDPDLVQSSQMEELDLPSSQTSSLAEDAHKAPPPTTRRGVPRGPRVTKPKAKALSKPSVAKAKVTKTAATSDDAVATSSAEAVAGKGPDFTGNDAANFASAGLRPPRSSAETFEVYYRRALENDAINAQTMRLINTRIDELTAVIEQERENNGHRIDRHSRLLGEHKESIASTQRVAAQAQRSTDQVTSRLDILDRSVDGLAAKTTRIEHSVQSVEAQADSLGGAVTFMDERLDETRNELSRGHRAGPSPSLIPPPGLYDDDEVDNTPFASAAPPMVAVGSKRAAASLGSLNPPAKRFHTSVDSSPGAGSSSGAKGANTGGHGTNGQRGKRNWRHSDSSRLPAVLPNDVIITFPKSGGHAPQMAAWVVSLLNIPANDLVSAMHTSADHRFVSARMRTHKAAATLVNACRNGGLPPQLRIRAEWSDPRSENIVQALMDEGGHAEGL